MLFQKGHKINLGKKNTLGKHWKIKDTSKMKEASIKKWQNLEYKQNQIKKKKGKKHTWGKKISEAMKRHIVTKETRRKISESHKGLKLSEKTRKKMSRSKTGEEHPNWQGGISFEPYSVDWTDDLKRAIRKRDRYTCQICGKEPAIIIHHIDYDKKNCGSDNLITLCKKCHGKTNHNRNYWINYLRQGL